MLKNKKSFAVILSLVMLLAMACGAWAVTGQQKADGNDADPAKRSITILDNIETTVDDTAGHGLYALYGGTITNSGYNVETSGDAAYGVWATFASSIDMKGNILTKGARARGAQASAGSYVKLEGDVTTHGVSALAIVAYNPTASSADTSTLVFTGNIVTYGLTAHGAVADTNAVLRISNSTITTHEERSHGVHVVNSSDVKLEDVTITINHETAWAIAQTNGNTAIILTGVETEGQNAFRARSGGTVVATDSTLAGKVLYDDELDTTEIPLDLILENSTLNGAVISSGDKGVIDITLIGSNWNVTDDSNTNGTVTGDGNSTISYTLSPEDTEVIIDKLKGTAGIDMKIGDQLIIRNPDGDISSSNPDVIEVVVDEVTGEVSIISKADGEAELTYSYIDENNKIQTVTVTVVSGAGSEPESNGGGGGSSNCNAGMGIGALVSLLGLALVMRKK